MSPLLSRLGVGRGGFSFGKRKPASGGGGAFSASGGDIADALAPGNGYKYHTFGTPGSFIASSPGTVDMLVVGGGGAGHGFGGGGAGAVVHVTSYSLAAGTYPIAVGDGGVLPAGPTPSANQIATIQGKNTTFGSIVTAGGGGASQEILYPNIAGQPGGSGGGGDGSNSPGDPGGTAVNPGNLAGGTYYGNPGGPGGPRADGGGGGGAGGAGASDGSGGTGGAGYPFPTFAYPLCFPAPYLPGFATPGNPIPGYTPSPNATHYGGGGGGSQAESGTPRAGGTGGGGGSSFAPALNQPYPSANSGKDGLEYLGAGGGGGQTQSGVGGNPGGQGGRGVVIIRYLAS